MPAIRSNRLLDHFNGRGAWTTLAEHRERFPKPPVGRSASLHLMELVAQAGLRGRGGAGFPTATKMRAVAAGRRRAIVVANGSEGEPTSHKDATVMTHAPHLVLDGALVAAAAVGADEVIVGVVIHTGASRDALRRAAAERYRAEPASPRIRMVDVPSTYLAGEERALTHLINGGPPIPTSGPRPFEQGVGGRPTLIQNVETLAHLALIYRGGAEAFRQTGSPETPGTMLVTISGGVGKPGVYEVSAGMALTEVLRAAGGAPEGISAVLIGGYSGTWLTPSRAARVRLDHADLAAEGAILGCASIVVLPDGGCVIRETAGVLHWLARQTAGQCGPCVHGLAAVSLATEQLQTGQADARTLSRLAHWSDDIEGRGACRYPDGAIRLLRSALRSFESDAKSHQAGAPCAGASRPSTLPLPAVPRPT
ncbi:MAG: NADH-ubiquinone oxidoreductase-F iron-sulfur binding region domain-containing protein [Actinomycetota bacterium]